MAPGAAKVGVCPIFMIFGRLPEPSGAVWMGLNKKQIKLRGTVVHVLRIHQKKIWRIHLIILLEGSKNKVEILMFTYLGEPSARRLPQRINKLK